MKRNKLRRSHLFHNYYSRLKMIALSVFKWEGLPDSCNARFLENSLFNHGKAIFVNDEDMGFLNLNVTPSDILNVYNEPLSYMAYSINYSKNFDRDNCVYIRNNLLEVPTDWTIMLYAERLALLDGAIGVNINAQKTPILIRTDEKTRITFEKVYENYEGDSPVIFGAKNLIDKPLEVLKTDAPFVADKLRDEKRAVWNECLEFLGLNTNPSDKKKERLIVSEVDSNNEQIDIQGHSMLYTRKLACEEINKRYGLNVSVRKSLESEVFENGKIHNRIEDNN